jgi:glutamate/tyrosine decarboxylase-like PLP-dependent enzyme
LLRQQLIDYAQKRQAVYAVVAIMGSTEEGAVERLSKILEIRKEMQDVYGMTFLVHADAAWGGYFATMLNPKNEEPGESAGERLDRSKGHLVPSLCLKKGTDKDLRALKDADSITVDPHKAGYVPYPAGSLVYRDGRMRYLVTWSSPYLSQGSSENIGIYGVEGR